MPSVTDPVTAGLLAHMKHHIQTTAIPQLFFEKSRDRQDVGPVYDASGNSLKLTKTSYTSSQPHFVGIGYDLTVTIGGVEEQLNMWLVSPSDRVGVNRVAIMDGLQMIIDNPHSGKFSFNVRVPEVAAKYGMRY